MLESKGRPGAGIIEERARVSMTNVLPFVTVIIPNHDGIGFLDRCFSSLSQTDYPKSNYEVILVDNGSEDQSIEYVKKKFPWVRVLALNRNYGYTGGNNRGVHLAKGELVAFLNNDTAVDSKWLRELVNVMLFDNRVAICGSQVVLLDKPDHIQYSGGFLNLVGGALFYPFHRSKPDRDFYLVGSICGASFLIRKTVFETLGGFDESFFMYSEENDLCLRAWICGYRVVYVPRSIVHHSGGSSQKSGGNSCLVSPLEARLASPLTAYHGNKNSISSLVKNFEPRDLSVGVLLTLLYGAVQLAELLKKNNAKKAILLIRGYWWPVRNFKSLWRKRLTIQIMRKVNDSELARMGVLLSASRMIKAILPRSFDQIRRCASGQGKKS